MSNFKEMTLEQLVNFVIENEIADEFENSYKDMSVEEVDIVFQEYGYFYDKDKGIYVLDEEKVNYK